VVAIRPNGFYHQPQSVERPRGLPIGNLTSQLWGNFFLDDFDHWITEEKWIGAYG
jgi:hypothetical protein